MSDVFPGGVFDGSLADGRAAAELVPLGSGLEARLMDGRRFHIPAQQLRVSLGGASGRMWLCRGAGSDPCIFSEAPGFAQGLAEISSEVAEQVAALNRAKATAASRGRAWLWAVTALLVAALWLLPALWRWGIDHAAQALPVRADEQLGELAWGQQRAQLAIVELAETEQFFNALLERLRPHLPAGGEQFTYRVAVVRDPQVNAFALPGGQIVFYTGLLAAAEDPEEIAAVLGHEMAHVFHRHGVQRIAHGLGVVAGIQLLLGDVAGLAVLARELLTAAAINDYGRDQEREADESGVRLLQAAGLDPLALDRFFARLQERGGAMPAYLQWLSTHPSHNERQARLRALVADLPSVEPQPLAVDLAKLKAALALPSNSPEHAQPEEGK